MKENLFIRPLKNEIYKCITSVSKNVCIDNIPKSLGANVKVELDLSNYATKSYLKNETGVDTSDFAKKSWFS